MAAEGIAGCSHPGHLTLRFRMNREEPRKEVRAEGQHDEPESDAHHDSTTSALYHSSPYVGHARHHLLGCGYRKAQSEHEKQQREPCEAEGGHCRLRAAQGEGMSG